MKTFIYFSQGEWRTFYAEELPVKPEFVNFMKVNFSHDKASYECALEKYESEIAALKAKSVKVYNSDILEHVCYMCTPMTKDDWKLVHHEI